MNEPPIYFDRSPAPYNERQALVEHICGLIGSALRHHIGSPATPMRLAVMAGDIRNAFAVSADREEMIEWGVMRYLDIAAVSIEVIVLSDGGISPRIDWRGTVFERFTGPWIP